MTSRRASAFVVMLSVTALVLAALGQRSADATHMTVTEVEGSAFGYHAFDFSLFGGAQPDVGPTPVVSLAPDASNSPQAATAPQGEVVYGPATIFTSGPITVTTEGSLGPTGVVTSSANVQDVNRGGSEVFDADNVASTCTASEAGVSGTTTITNGTIRTHAQATDHPEGVVQIPTNPTPGFTVEGHVHIGNTQDNFRYVFNEQIVNPDGSITVNAVHAYFLGPTAVGELIIGQVVCGVTTVAQETTTTTVPEETTTTTVPEETTTTTVPQETTTTTVPQETTTTTVPQETTTTTTGAGAACVPGEDGAKPGYGHGDKNHRHCGPPGLTGNRPGNAERGVDGRPVSSSGNVPPAWLLAGLGVLFLAPLILPFRRSHRGGDRA